MCCVRLCAALLNNSLHLDSFHCTVSRIFAKVYYTVALRPEQNMADAGKNLLDEDRRRLQDAVAKPSLFRRSNQVVLAASQEEDNNRNVDSDVDEPENNNNNNDTTAQGQSPLTFTLTRIAKLSQVSEDIITEEAKGKLAQFRAPNFAIGEVVKRNLHAWLPTSDLGLSTQDSTEGGSSHYMVVDVLSASLVGEMKQVSGETFCRQYQAKVRKAYVEQLGIAFGVVVAYPYSEAIRVKLTADFGGHEVLARCYDSDPFKNGEEVLLTVEPGCIRVHGARPKRALGKWAIKKGMVANADTEAASPDDDAAEKEADEQKKKPKRKFGRKRARDEPLIDELALIPLTTEEMTERKSARDQRKKQQERPFGAEGDADNTPAERPKRTRPSQKEAEAPADAQEAKDEDDAPTKAPIAQPASAPKAVAVAPIHAPRKQEEPPDLAAASKNQKVLFDDDSDDD